jgi:hypothetical protein
MTKSASQTDMMKIACEKEELTLIELLETKILLSILLDDRFTASAEIF